MRKRIEIWMAVLLLCSGGVVSYWGVTTVVSKRKGERISIVIDPGHGGIDPGKVAKDGTKEKDINLEIALALGKYLKKQGWEVHYTRQKDQGLYLSETKNKKVEDMQKRCEIAENIQPDLMISIHQNSFGQSEVKGAQVFYYETSEESKHLAEAVQKALIAYVDHKNHRQAKANDSYYILKKTSCPTLIIECGFLSNERELEKLKTKSYQKLLVQGIYKGIAEYFREKNHM